MPIAVRVCTGSCRIGDDGTMATLEVSPDRLFPPDPATRDVARTLYHQVKDLPIISPHGHVPPAWIANDEPFTDATSLLITPDHYVTRLMHAQGVSLADLGVAQTEFSAEQRRHAFRLLCQHWPSYRGTPVKFWFEAELVDVFGLYIVPSAETADLLYDAINERLASPEFRPRALFKRFNIEFMATTDDPADDLPYHRQLAEDPTWDGRVAPCFRPDKYLEAFRDDWVQLTENLARAADVDTSSYAGWQEAMEQRRGYFKQHGATSTDHSHWDARVEPLPATVAERLYAKGLAKTITKDEADTLRREMMFQMARMASEDGLVMTMHPAVYRNHSTATMNTYGLDVGADIPISVEFTRAVQPMLDAFGLNPNFQVVLFTIDEDVYSRELAPLAGFYPSVLVGAPWWFIDAPDSITRFRSAVTETAGFANTCGFIDDTRAYLSIPARHDTNRRLDSVFLARLVGDHRLSMEEAMDEAVKLVVDYPRKAFRL
jgi:glucuronate isomerase